MTHTRSNLTAILRETGHRSLTCGSILRRTGLKVAVDYLAGIRELMGAGRHYYAPFALLRASLESSAAAWLLEPDDRTTRLQRLVGMHIDDTNNKKAVHFMVPERFRVRSITSPVSQRW